MLTKCEQMRSKAKMKLLLGAKTPQCEADGSFKKVQSWEGYQWCVDENGIELPGTRVGRGGGKPDCSNGLFIKFEHIYLCFYCCSDKFYLAYFKFCLV